MVELISVMPGREPPPPLRTDPGYIPSPTTRPTGLTEQEQRKAEFAKQRDIRAIQAETARALDPHTARTATKALERLTGSREAAQKLISERKRQLEVGRRAGFVPLTKEQLEQVQAQQTSARRAYAEFRTLEEEALKKREIEKVVPPVSMVEPAPPEPTWRKLAREAKEKLRLKEAGEVFFGLGVKEKWEERDLRMGLLGYEFPAKPSAEFAGAVAPFVSPIGIPAQRLVGIGFGALPKYAQIRAGILGTGFYAKEVVRAVVEKRWGEVAAVPIEITAMGTFMRGKPKFKPEPKKLPKYVFKPEPKVPTKIPPIGELVTRPPIRIELSKKLLTRSVRKYAKQRGIKYDELSKIDQEFLKGQVAARIRAQPELYIPKERLRALKRVEPRLERERLTERGIRLREQELVRQKEEVRNILGIKERVEPTRFIPKERRRALEVFEKAKVKPKIKEPLVLFTGDLYPKLPPKVSPGRIVTGDLKPKLGRLSEEQFFKMQMGEIGKIETEKGIVGLISKIKVKEPKPFIPKVKGKLVTGDLLPTPPKGYRPLTFGVEKGKAITAFVSEAQLKAMKARAKARLKAELTPIKKTELVREKIIEQQAAKVRAAERKLEEEMKKKIVKITKEGQILLLEPPKLVPKVKERIVTGDLFKPTVTPVSVSLEPLRIPKPKKAVAILEPSPYAGMGIYEKGEIFPVYVPKKGEMEFPNIGAEMEWESFSQFGRLAGKLTGRMPTVRDSVLQTTIVSPRERIKGIQRGLQRQAQVQAEAQEFFSLQIQKQIPAQVQRQRVRERLKIKERLREELRLRERIKPPPPIIKKPKLKPPVKEIITKLKKAPGYELYVKRFGKFGKVGKVLTREKAILKGEKIVSETLSAQFKIAKTKQQVWSTGKVYMPSTKVFRHYKKRGKIRIPMEERWIERRKYRLKQKLEQKQIQAARRKSPFFKSKLSKRKGGSWI